MRHQPIHRGVIQAVGAERFLDRLAEVDDRDLEDFTAGHADGGAAAAVQQFLVGAIRMQMGGQNARLLGRL